MKRQRKHLPPDTRNKSTQHGSYRTGKVGHQPDQPDDQAEFMEAFQLVLILTDEHHGSPERVAEHKQDRQQSGDAVEIESPAARDLAHQGRTGGIKNKPDPEKDQVFQLQATGEFFAPYPQSIENQGQANRNNCDNHFFIQINSPNKN